MIFLTLPQFFIHYNTFIYIQITLDKYVLTNIQNAKSILFFLFFFQSLFPFHFHFHFHFCSDSCEQRMNEKSNQNAFVGKPRQNSPRYFFEASCTNTVFFLARLPPVGRCLSVVVCRSFPFFLCSACWSHFVSSCTL